MNLKRVRSLFVSALSLSLPLFAACAAPIDESADGTDEGSVGVADQALVTSGAALQISAGPTSTLALMAGGTIASFGANSHGQLGYATTAPQLVPGSISGLSGFKAVSAGVDYTLALKSDGTLWAFGSNTWGRLGIGMSSFGDQPTPTQVSGLSDVTAVSAGPSYAHALKSDGTVWSWGFNGEGQLGSGTSVGHTIAPVQVKAQVGGGLASLSGITMLAAGQATLALKSDGTVWAWGRNTHGQVGNGNTDDQDAAVPVQLGGGVALSDITAVAAGKNSIASFALASDGTVWAWGGNGNGQMGHGTSGADQLVPARVMIGSVPLAGVTAVVAFGNSVLALKLDGTVWAWGNNTSHCELARTGGPSSTPAQISGLSGVTAIAGGTTNAFARTSDGKIWAWGDNGDGQIGDGTTTTACTPQVILAP